MPKQIKNTVEEINKNELTDSSLTYTETVSEVINSSMNANSTKVPDQNTTIDQDEFINKTYNLIDTDNNIASLEPTVIVNVGEITIPTPISKTTNTSEDLPLNSAPTQTSLNDTLPLNITGKTVLREKTDNAIVKQYTQEVKTIIENMPEVPIPNNVTDENTQIDSINVLKANESDTTFDNITSSISTLTTTTPSTILIDTTLTPVPTNMIQTGLNEITTISSATILDATANSTSESTLEPVNTTDATQITVLRESIPAEKNQTNDPNGPLETNVDFNKTKSGDDLTRAPQLIIQQTEPTLQFESMTSSPSATTVPEIQSVTEFTVTNSSKGLVENLTLTQGNDTTTTGDSILTAESEVINTVENVATNVNENNSSYVRNGEVLATEVSVESTTSSTNSSIISITQNQREEATSTVATSQTQTTHSPFQLELTDVVPEIKETNETRSIILRDGFNSTVTQDPRTNTTIVKRIIVDDTTGIGSADSKSRQRNITFNA
ncbi:uncharacterized protein DDB_G0290587-like [Trichoplusia ni]|uniref:Uncharacterized protein DDB_G0290587-like n=1 Tax=Trichoplusia ni TaxID=7111 RepID=A0A7E5WDZ2_TRINI|nr:uncharacterized protein DDB_G0290587-like [Trichoplusia ni]